MLKTLAIGAAALALAAPAGAAFAHDDNYGSTYGYYSYRAEQDRAEHCDYHAEERAAHDEAHWQGFWSSREHSDWHRNERAAHRALHDDHPSARGGCRSYYGSYGGYGRSGYGGYRGYQPSYGYDYTY